MLLRAQDIIHASVATYQKHWREIFKYIAILAIVWGLLVLNSLYPISYALHHPAKIYLYLSMAIQVLILSLFFWGKIALQRVLARAYQNAPLVPIHEELKQSAKLWWSALAISIVLSAVVTVGTILFIIPGLILAFWYYFVLLEVILDNQSIKQSFTNSKALVVGRAWAVLWRLLAPTLVLTIFFSTLEWMIITPGQYFLATSHNVTVYYLTITLGILLFFLLFPLFLLMPIVLYRNLQGNSGPGQDPRPSTKPVPNNFT